MDCVPTESRGDTWRGREGGKGIALALLATHRLQVVGIDERRTRDHLEMNDLVVDHISAVRSLPGYGPDVPIVFIPENMSGHNHTVMEEAVARLPNVDVLYEHGKSTPGVIKSPYVTKAYVRITLAMLVHHNIMIDKRWMSVTAADHPEGQQTGRRKIWEELHDQLSRYGYDEKEKLTGKFGGLFRDDLCIAFQMLCYWSEAVEKQGTGSPYAPLRRIPGGSTPATEREYYQQIQYPTPGVPQNVPPHPRSMQSGIRTGQSSVNAVIRRY